MTELDCTRFQYCGKCGCYKPLTPEFFARNKRMRLGFLSTCKVCQSIYRKAYYQANREKAIEDTKRWYHENRAAALAYSARYREEHKEQRRASIADWRRNNRERAAASEKAWREANKERKAALDKAWREANKERVKQNQRDWYQANKTERRERAAEYRERNRERVRAYARWWYHQNRERMLIVLRKREAERRGRIRSQAGEPYTVEDILQMYDDQDGRCAYCEEPLLGDFEIDHMVPLSRNGLDGWDNFAITCPPCNRTKNTRTAEEFMELLGRGS